MLANRGGSGIESSGAVLDRVVRARERQIRRFPQGSGVFCNGQMEPAQVRRWCRPTPDAGRLLLRAMDRLALSARAHDRVLKVARTVADLAGADRVDEAAVAEALQYREALGDPVNSRVVPGYSEGPASTP